MYLYQTVILLSTPKMAGKWTETPLGQSIFAISIISLVSIICVFSSLDFLTLSVVILLLPAGFLNPYVFCLIFFTFSIFRLHEVIPILNPLYIPFISALLGILSLSANAILGRIKLYWFKEMTLFTAFFIWVTLGIPLAYTPSVSYEYWSQEFLKVFIIFFMITWTMTKKIAYTLIVYLIVLGGTFLSLIVLYKLSHNAALIEKTRATLGALGGSSIGDPNDLALTLLFSFSFSCSILVSSFQSLRLRLSGLLSSGTLMTAIVATQSRGGLIGLAAVIGYFATYRMKSKLLALFLMTIAILFLYLIVSSGFSRFSGTINEGLDTSSMGRVHAWEAAINMAIHHPLFGVGLHEFQDNYYTYAIVWDKQQIVAHSSWFGVLAETGFPGLALFIYCVYSALKIASKNINRIESDPNQLYAQTPIYPIVAQGLFAGLISYCFTGTFLSQGFTWPFYSFFALTIAFAHTINQGMSEPAGTT